MKSFRDLCEHCGQGCDGMNFVKATPPAVVAKHGPFLSNGQVATGTICSIQCLDGWREKERVSA